MKYSSSTVARALLEVIQKQAQEHDLNPQQIVAELGKLTSTEQNTVAEIRTTHKLSDHTLKKIVSFLKKQLHRDELEIKQVIDPAVIGGFIALVNDQEFDFSIRSALMRLRSYA